MNAPEFDGTPMTRKRRRRKDATRLVAAGVSSKEPRQHFACLGCGDTLYIELPMASEIFVAMTKAFVKMHLGCKVPVAALRSLDAEPTETVPEEET